MDMKEGLTVSPMRLEEREFAQRWDFEHVTSSPRYHQSNGQVERAFGTVKNIVKKPMEEAATCRTLLPIQRSRLILKLATDVYRDKKIAKNAHIEQYNKSAHHLNPLAPGDTIRMKLAGQDTWTWTLGECTKKLSVQGHTYRRNRRHLRLVYENLPVPDSEPWETRANPLPIEAGPMYRTTPRAKTSLRMPMTKLPPCEEPMPIQDTPQPRVDSTPMHT
ncbi:hypothetical protein NP493_156g02012 [Ridgeia piscesae]|uniref:Integrase catalytic domain-containing protein n=1 Tax=Ridgeia piscesae TaxID=27915 RepID=A0AAD9P3W4_RIDPI|nr:hypothetical protein NP493_156g02012 [Ridgeia piscesae]